MELHTIKGSTKTAYVIKRYRFKERVLNRVKKIPVQSGKIFSEKGGDTRESLKTNKERKRKKKKKKEVQNKKTLCFLEGGATIPN